MFSFGSAEKGQLGNGTTGERIATGNKTSYDIEVDPGVYCLLLAAPILTSIPLSLYQRAGRQKDSPHFVRATA